MAVVSASIKSAKRTANGSPPMKALVATLTSSPAGGALKAIAAVATPMGVIAAGVVVGEVGAGGVVGGVGAVSVRPSRSGESAGALRAAPTRRPLARGGLAGASRPSRRPTIHAAAVIVGVLIGTAIARAAGGRDLVTPQAGRPRPGPSACSARATTVRVGAACPAGSCRRSPVGGREGRA